MPLGAEGAEGTVVLMKLSAEKGPVCLDKSLLASCQQMPVEERFQPLDVIYPTELKTAHQSHTLCIQMSLQYLQPKETKGGGDRSLGRYP